MTPSDRVHTKRAVWGIALLIAGYSAIMPLVHLWVAWAPPKGMAFTGMHHSDTVVFLHCMRMFATDFYSPFASCHAELGAHSVRYFATPFYWIYGAIGAIGRVCNANECIALGLANGLSTAVFLCAVYTFFRSAAPRQARLAFVLFVLGGGVGGLTYLASGALGLHGSTQFDTYFKWFTLSLVEGNANVKMPRLYYTLPFAMGMFGLTLTIRNATRSAVLPMAASTLLIAVGSFFNVRLAPLFFGTGLLYLWLGAAGKPVKPRVANASFLFAGVLLGGVAGVFVMRLSPTFYNNAFSSVRDSLSLGAYVLDTLPLLIAASVAVWQTRSDTGRLGRVALAAAGGYIVAYAVLYAAFHTYYGTWLIVHDYAAPIAVSDWAFVGAGAGAVWAWRRRVPQSGCVEGHGWIAIWFLAFLALAITAFGAGWFMRFTPSRIHCILGMPLSLLAAAGIHRVQARRPVLARALTAVILVCGISTTLVSALCFMGPLGWKPDASPFAYIHGESMTLADAEVIAHMPPGRVLTQYTPGPQISDVISLRPQNSVVLGMGTMNLSDLSASEMAAAVDRFFQIETTDEERRAFVRNWCVDYILCSDTHKQDDAVERELRKSNWLQLDHEQGGAVLFRVMPG
ncbi:MAG: hypothetical protein K1Y02_05645 [Candidatus Hydrogenedentes bacterium]|nr:hypothetical protein [Candidatus Hydrogenedentota bacterium]